MPKLTDTQRVILSAAAKRADGAVLPVPKSLNTKGPALKAILDGLCKQGLLVEQPVPRDALAWRKDEDGQPWAVFVTKAGQVAIGVRPEPQSASKAKPSSRLGRRKERRREVRPKPRLGSSGAGRSGTKQSLLIDLLGRKTGATLAEIAAATGWQPHSIRGAISGTLKKKLGLAVVSEKIQTRGRVYRIAGHG